MKRCSNCFAYKPLDAFYVKRPASYQSRCKACNAEVVAGYQARKIEDLRDRLQERISGGNIGYSGPEKVKTNFKGKSKFL